MTIELYTSSSLHEAECVLVRNQDDVSALFKIRRGMEERVPSDWYRFAGFVVAPVLAAFVRWVVGGAAAVRGGAGKLPLFLAAMPEGRLLSCLLDGLFNTVSREIWVGRVTQGGDSSSSLRALFAERFFSHWERCVRGEDRDVFLVGLSFDRAVMALVREMIQARGWRGSVRTFSLFGEEPAAGGDDCCFLRDDALRGFGRLDGTRASLVMQRFIAHPSGFSGDYDSEGHPVVDSLQIDGRRKALLLDTQDRLVQMAFAYHEALGARLSPDLARCVWQRFMTAPFVEELALF